MTTSSKPASRAPATTTAAPRASDMGAEDEAPEDARRSIDKQAQPLVKKRATVARSPRRTKSK